MFKLTLFVLGVSLACCLASEDKDLDAPGLIESRGFTPKAVTVQTSDGYILTMFRIVNPVWKGATKKPVLLQHGMLANSDYWMTNTHGKMNASGTYIEDTGVVTDCSAANASLVGNTLPFVLAACGYDVWLGNQRGTRYSSAHVKYNAAKDADFWNYCVDDLEKDASAMVNHIKNETKSDTVAYIGHSMGTTQMLELLTEDQNMNKIVKPFIALAPVAYLAHIQELIRFAALIEPLIENIKGPLLLTPSQELKYDEKIITNICTLPVIDKVCESVIKTILGIEAQDISMNDYLDKLGHLPDEISFKILAQMAFRADTNTFEKWDYRLTNLIHYGTLTPPKYDLSKITTPNMVFMSGQSDNLATPKDIDKMRHELKVKLYEDYVVPDPKWAHLDFTWANTAGKLINAPVLEILNKLS